MHEGSLFLGLFYGNIGWRITEIDTCIFCTRILRIPCRVIEKTKYPHEDMDSWDVCPEVISSIGHHMDDREEEEEHIWICISKEKHNQSTKKRDRDTRNDIYPKLTIFLDPE